MWKFVAASEPLTARKNVVFLIFLLIEVVKAPASSKLIAKE